MRILLLAAGLLAVTCASLSAKQTPPMNATFSIESVEINAGEAEYKARFDLLPEIGADKIILRLEVPEGVTVVKGFLYWEGILAGRSLFTRQFTFKAAADKETEVKVIVQMLLDNDTRFNLVVPLVLSKDAGREKGGVITGDSTIKPFQTPGNRRTRR